MPRGDGTGPVGMGPMTGRAAGFCNGFEAPGYENSIGFGRGPGRGFRSGGGRGYRRMFYATGMPGWARYGYVSDTTAAQDEKAYLSNQAEFLESQLYQIKKRLSGLNEETD